MTLLELAKQKAGECMKKREQCMEREQRLAKEQEMWEGLIDYLEMKKEPGDEE